MTFGEYEPLARAIIDDNEFQRKRVKNDTSPYRLLQRDLVDGCVMPPITLAATEDFSQAHKDHIQDIIDRDNVSDEDVKFLNQLLTSAFAEGHLIILDGLQRTYTILGVMESLQEDKLEEFKERKARFEIYIGLKKNGILYRMMTLNTAQTPMSFRHQLEILYHDYIDRENLPDDLEIVREQDGQRARGIDRFQYRDTIDMFYAYSAGTSAPADKSVIIDRLSEFQFLESYKFESDEPLTLLISYHTLVKRIDELSNGWELDSDLLEESDVTRPFGKTTESIFCRSQPMTGFGAEVNKLLDRSHYNSVSEITDAAGKLHFGSDDPSTAFTKLIIVLNEIALHSKRIGNDQRSFFQLLWRSLLLPEIESVHNIPGAIDKAYETFVTLYR